MLYGGWVGQAELTDTETDERIRRLYEFNDLGVTRMVISGMYMPPSFLPTPDAGIDGELLDTITARAWVLFPHYFIPFVRGFALDDPDAPDYVESWLEAGFQGVGELFVHGHGADHNDNDSLIRLFQVAARKGVPVQVHWEIGKVDNPNVRTAQQNFDQLKEVLDAFPNVAMSEAIGRFRPPLKLILAHCGAGPEARTMDDAEMSTFAGRLDALLAYENVYFDIAGTIGVGGSDFWDFDERRPTDVGEVVLLKMRDWPDRFMLGLDVENGRLQSEGDHPGLMEYRNSVPVYLKYLEYGQFDAVAHKKILSENARAVLYQEAMPFMAPTQRWP